MNIYQYVAMVIAIITVVVGSTYFLLSIGSALLKKLTNVQTDLENSKGDAAMVDSLYFLIIFIMVVVIFSIDQSNVSKVATNTIHKKFEYIKWMSLVSNIYGFLLTIFTLVVMVKFNKISMSILEKPRQSKRIWQEVPVIIVVLSGALFALAFYYYLNVLDAVSIVMFFGAYYIDTFISYSLFRTFASINDLEKVRICLSYNGNSKLEMTCRIIMEHGEFYVVTEDGKAFIYINRKNIDRIYPIIPLKNDKGKVDVDGKLNK